MKATNPGLSILLLVVFGIVVTMGRPMPAFAQGRGVGRDFDKFEKKRQKDFDKRERKREKFINGHDARDGRWDGRGPRSRSTESFDRGDRRWDRRHNGWNHRDGRWDWRNGRRERRDLARYRRQYR